MIQMEAVTNRRHGRGRGPRSLFCQRMGRISVVMAALAVAGAARGASQESNQTAPISNSVNAQQYWFGVAVENISPAVAKQHKLLPEQGVMVIAVFEGSPAERAGMRAEDLLIEINGKPLTSQEELARAANLPNVVKGATNKTPTSGMQSSEVVYLRAGERMKAQLTPAPRPTEMQASAANPAPNRANNWSQNATNPAARQGEQRNMVLSNNLSVQYGPGYQFDSQAQGNSKLLRDAVSNGSLLITQDTDENGNVIKTTFKNGGNSYVLEPGNVEKLPANLRPLALQILAAPQGANLAQQQANNNNDNGRGAVRQNSTETDDRLKRLEQQNEELRKQLEEVKKLLLEANRQAAPAGRGN
jgi:hypothetical protein